MHTNLYIVCILIEISVKIRMAKKSEGSYLSCVTNGEFYFSDNNFETLSSTQSQSVLSFNIFARTSYRKKERGTTLQTFWAR